jgi:nucleotide-binding universal stress UspA family protein
LIKPIGSAGEEALMYKKIVVTLDGSELSECVIPHLEAFRKGFPESEVTLLRVVEPVDSTVAAHADVISPEQWKARENAMVVDAADYLTKVAGRLEEGGTPVHSNVIIGRVEDRIIDFAKDENVELIIMATHGRSGVSRWVRGSVADRILRMAHIPVLMVRAPGTRRA